MNDVVTIQIHTFGLDPLRVDFKADYEEIHREYKDYFKVDLHVIIDCRRQFNKPKCKRGHNGHHDAFISGIVAKPEFKDWLAEVKETFMKAHEDHNPDETFHVGLFCKAGSNRSVACSLLLETIWKRAWNSGYTVLPVIHRSQEFWEARGICNSECETCVNGENMTFKKFEALRKACHTWNEV